MSWETYESEPAYVRNEETGRREVKGLTFPNLKHPLSIIYPLHTLEFSEIEGIFTFVKAANDEEYVVLKEQMKDFAVRVDDEVRDILADGFSDWLDAGNERGEIHASTDKTVREVGGYTTFYRAISRPDRFAAIHIDVDWKDKTARFMRWVGNKHICGHTGMCELQEGFTYILRQGWKTFFNIIRGFNNQPDDWRKEHGRLLKTGKVFKIFATGADDHQVETICHYINNILRDRNASTEDVQVSYTPSEVYTLPFRKADDLCNSCMRSEHAERFQLYDDIDTCGIAYITDGSGYLIGRALIWDKVEVPRSNDIKILDRCYFKDHNVLASLLKWAKDNGYWVKKYPERANCGHYISPSGEEEYFPDLMVDTGFELMNEMYNEIPYIDTFCYARSGGRHLYSLDGGGMGEFRDVDGRGDFLTGDYPELCNDCNRRLSEDEQIYSDRDDVYYCVNCYNERYTLCDRCHTDIPREETMQVHGRDGYWQTWCEDCCNDHAVICRECGSYFHENSEQIIEVETEVGEEEIEYICENCEEKLRGEAA